MYKFISYFWHSSVVILLTACLSLTANAKSKKQNILLDVNGQALSIETLELLSSASKKFKPPSRSSKSINSASKKGKKKTHSKDKKTAPVKFISTPKAEMELLESLKAGKIPHVKYLLKKGVKPRYQDSNGITPLRIAVTKGWASMIIELIEHGANVNEEGRRGLTLLHTAAARGLYDVAKVLVKAGIHPSTRTKTGWTPLHVAARYGHWQLVQYFIQLGVDPNAKNKQGRTALGLAMNLRHQGVVKILSRVTSVQSLDQVRMGNLRALRKSNNQKKRHKLEQVKEFRRMRRELKKNKK